VKPALRHPALQCTAGVGALLALTWPLLVFDRPLYVVGAFFAIWGVMIALLFVFSRAPEREVDARASDMPEGGELDARSD
jgi:hypothetical protein